MADFQGRVLQAQTFIAELARPFAIYVTSGAAAFAVCRIAWQVSADKLDLSAAAIFVGAVFGGVGALYGARAWENSQQGKHAATVQVEQAKAAASTGTPPAG